MSSDLNATPPMKPPSSISSDTSQPKLSLLERIELELGSLVDESIDSDEELTTSDDDLDSLTWSDDESFLTSLGKYDLGDGDAADIGQTTAHKKTPRIDYDLMYVTSKPSKKKNDMKGIALHMFERYLKSIDLHLEKILSTNGRNIFVKVRAGWRFLTDSAENLELVKSIAPNDLQKETSRFSSIAAKFTLAKPIPEPAPYSTEYRDCLCIPYQRRLHRSFMNAKDHEGFFSKLQRSYMVKHELDRARLVLREGYDGADVDHDLGLDVDDDAGDADTFKISYQWLKDNGVITSEFVPHDCRLKDLGKSDSPCMRDWLFRNGANLRAIGHKLPIDQLREYLGPGVAFHFAWVEYYTRMLLLPAIVSVIMLISGFGVAFVGDLVQTICHDESERIVCRTCPSTACHYAHLGYFCSHVRLSQIFDNPSNVAFSVVISIWAVVFLETWNRRQRDLAARWRTSHKLQSRDDDIRPDYMHKVKTTRLNKVTGEEEPYLKFASRYARLTVGFVCMAVCACSILAAMVGLIFYRQVVKQVLSAAGYYRLAGLSVGMFASMSASFINLIVINICQTIFPPFALFLTKLELHRTTPEFERSYTYKIFIFQFFNYYSTILFLAFFSGKNAQPPHRARTLVNTNCGPSGCMNTIMIQLFVIMTFRQLAQNLMSAVRTTVRRQFDRLQSRNVKNQWEEDYVLGDIPEPIAFDDYSEKIIQYGFITMFSPAFPLCALFAFLNNIYEIRADMKKYVVNYRRPAPRPTAGIGTWSEILSKLTTLSIIVNALLIAFNSLGLEVAYYDFSAKLYAENITMFQYLFSDFDPIDYGANDSVVGTSQFFQQYQLLNPENNSLEGYVEELRMRDTEYNQSFVEQCVYNARFYPPHSKEKYKLHPLFYSVLLSKLIFVFVFQNTAMIATEIISSYLSMQSDRSVKKTIREQYLNRELIQKYEKKEEGGDSQLEESVDGDMGNSYDSDSNSGSSETEQERKRKQKRGLCWNRLFRFIFDYL